MPEEIAAGSGIKETLICLPGQFSDGQGDCTVWPGTMDFGDDLRHPFFSEPSVLSALKDKGPESQPVSCITAGKNLLFCEAVADCIPVAPAYAAVIAVVPAVIGKFDEPADIDAVPVVPDPDFAGLGKQILGKLRRASPDQPDPLLTL